MFMKMIECVIICPGGLLKHVFLVVQFVYNEDIAIQLSTITIKARIVNFEAKSALARKQHDVT